MVCCPRVEDPSSVLLLLALLPNQFSSWCLYHPQLDLFLEILRPLTDNAHRSSYVVDYFHGFGIELGTSDKTYALTMKRVVSSSSDWATWAFSLFLCLLQQFLLRWPFFSHFEHRIGPSSVDSFCSPSFPCARLRGFHCFLPPLPPEDSLLSLTLSRSFKHASHSSSVRRRRPCLR